MDKLSHTAKPANSGAAIQFPAVTATFRELPNGLGIIVQEDHSAPVASVQVWIETGSIHEGRHLGGGMSHMLEHMLFKGTETRGASEFAQAIQDVGGYINAYTSFDRTVYWIDIPAKGVQVALDLLSDAVMNSTLPPDEYIKEQEVIRREFAMGNGRSGSRELQHALCHRLPLASLPASRSSAISTFSTKSARDEVMAYYKAATFRTTCFSWWWETSMPARCTRSLPSFSPHIRAAACRPFSFPQEPPQLGQPRAAHRISHGVDPPAPGVARAGGVASGYSGAGCGRGGARRGRSSHLYKKLREELALVHSADAWCYAPGQAGFFGVDAMLDPDKREAVQAETLRIIDELRAGGVTERELEKARKMALSHQLQSVTTMRGRASDLGSNWLLTGNLDFSRDYLEAIQNVTAEDIRRVLTTYVVTQSAELGFAESARVAAAETAPRDLRSRPVRSRNSSSPMACACSSAKTRGCRSSR